MKVQSVALLLSKEASVPVRLNSSHSTTCPHGILDSSVIDWLRHQSRKDSQCDAANDRRVGAGLRIILRQSLWVMLGPPRSGESALDITAARDYSE
ncbi:hypothetical protein INR49_030793 [Caranx melampygus]|nr:hypothetical protein INR49_030793 [Caranx melampygus]